jgi:glutamate racemase
MTMFFTLASKFFQPVSSITNIIAEYQRAQASGERIIELLETEPDIVDSPEIEELLRQILKDYIGKLDALVLGCTHYPFAAKAISRVLAGQTVLLEGGDGTARETLRRLAEAELLEEGEGEIRILNSAEDERMIQLSWQRLNS